MLTHCSPLRGWLPSVTLGHKHNQTWISWMTNSFKYTQIHLNFTLGFATVLPLQFSTGPSNFLKLWGLRRPLGSENAWGDWTRVARADVAGLDEVVQVRRSKQGRTFELKMLLSNTNSNPNKGGESVSFYLEYEYESELTRVCYCVCICIPV
jgi:hypothetical protein